MLGAMRHRSSVAGTILVAGVISGEGFDASLTASADGGRGAVIMINANDNSGASGRVRDAIATQYHWHDGR